MEKRCFSKNENYDAEMNNLMYANMHIKITEANFNNFPANGTQIFSELRLNKMLATYCTHLMDDMYGILCL